MMSLPDELLDHPFDRARALELGVSSRVLDGGRFARVFPRVYRHRRLQLTPGQWIDAARLTLPPEALLTGLTRIQSLGLDQGPRFPLRFVVVGDRHRPPDRIFLHRTRALPPGDSGDVDPAAAFIAYAARSRVVDAIRVGDWLLHEAHTTTADIERLALAQPWRDGAHEALWVLPHLDERSRSLPESELRAILTFAGLPRPLSNPSLPGIGDATAYGDLWFAEQQLLLEYEGVQHQLERGQYTSDIERYELLRRSEIPYVQVTKERLNQPHRLVGSIFRELVARGYVGPAPEFGDRWRTLHRPVSEQVGSRRDRVLAAARSAVA